LKSATDCCKIQQDSWGSARIARVSQQCLHENCPQILEKDQWPTNNSPNMNGIIPYLGSDAQNSFETFIRSPKQFPNWKSHWRRYGTILRRSN